MKFRSDSDNPSVRRVSKAIQEKKWNSKRRATHKTLLVLRKTTGNEVGGAGFGLFAPSTSLTRTKVAIKKSDLVTGFAGEFASKKDANTSRTHSVPAGNYGYGDGKKIRDLVIDNLDGQSQVNIIGSTKCNLAPASYGFCILWDMLGVLLNSSLGTGVAPNVSNPRVKEATTFHINSGAGDGRRVSRRLQGRNVPPDSFIMMPMYATRDIMEGEQLLWEYPWR